MGGIYEQRIGLGGEMLTARTVGEQILYIIINASASIRNIYLSIT